MHIVILKPFLTRVKTLGGLSGLINVFIQLHVAYNRHFVSPRWQPRRTLMSRTSNITGRVERNRKAHSYCDDANPPRSCFVLTGVGWRKRSSLSRRKSAMEWRSYDVVAGFSRVAINSGPPARGSRTSSIFSYTTAPSTSPFLVIGV